MSITQSTELGTLYTPDEVRALADQAHEHGLRLHLDGARISNAAASLGVPLRAFTTDAGVDLLSLGGTKNGLLYGEAVVVLDPAADGGLTYLRKMDMQLASKMRFVSAQLVALYEGDLWLRSAQHANAMAARLRAGHRGPAGRPGDPPDAGQRHLRRSSPPGVADVLRRRWRFYDWIVETGEVRLMCSFDTTDADIDELVAAVADAVS